MKRFYLLLASLFAFGTAQAQTFPEAGKSYYIIGTRAAIDAHLIKPVKAVDGGQFMQTAYDAADANMKFQFEEVTAEGTSETVKAYKMKNVGLNKYVKAVTGANNMTETKDDATTWYLFNSPMTGNNAKYAVGSFSISTAATASSTSDAWNDAGNNHAGLGLWQANNENSNWKLVEVTNPEADFVSAIYTNAYADFTAKVAAWEGVTSDDYLFYPSAAKVAALKAEVEALSNPTTVAQAQENITTLNQKVLCSKVMNDKTPATGFYRIKIDNKNHVISAAVNHNTKSVGNTEKAARTIWEISVQENGIYIKNAVTGEYLQGVTSGQIVKSATSPVLYSVVAPLGDGKVGFGTGAGEQSLHSDASNNIVGWSTNATDLNSFLTVEAVDASELNAGSEAMQAEKTLAATESASLEVAASVAPLMTILGVTGNASGCVESLRDYVGGNIGNAVVYTMAAGNVYRISTAGANAVTGCSLAFDAAGKAKFIATNEKDLNQLWKLVPNGQGFTLVNLNKAAVGGEETAALGQVAGGSSSQADMVKEDGAVGVYWINVYNADNKIIKLAHNYSTYGGAEQQRINVEKDGSKNEGYLNSWGGTNAELSIALVESVDIDLNDGGDGKYYATAYLPFAVSGVANAKAYTAAAPAAGAIALTEAANVAAKQGIVLIGESAGAATLTIGEGTATSALQGTTVAKTVDANSVLTLGKSGESVGFFAYTGTELRANSAYLEAGTGAAALVFSFGDTDAIQGIEAADNRADKIFDLSGRRISKAGKGIYIVNGKKVIK